jgi:hypothetical protein
VISESSATSTAAFPATYSARERGRDRYSGRAPLTRSGETNTGATHAVRKKARKPWMVSATRKNSGRITSVSAGSRSSARAAALFAM